MTYDTTYCMLIECGYIEYTSHIKGSVLQCVSCQEKGCIFTQGVGCILVSSCESQLHSYNASAESSCKHLNKPVQSANSSSFAEHSFL